MGTYRTNKLHVRQALEITGTRVYADRVEVLTKHTNKLQFEAPLHSDYVWEVGVVHSEIGSGEEIDKSQFDGKYLYKCVNREGKGYLLILQLFPDSVVYEGGSEGKGLYFETDLGQAVSYFTTRDSGRVYTDDVHAPDFEEHPGKVDSGADIGELV
jgi:hypothetical protein